MNATHLGPLTTCVIFYWQNGQLFLLAFSSHSSPL